MGWGSQDDANHDQPSERPMILKTETVECPPELSAQTAAIGGSYKSYPLYICIWASDTVGGPCKGDDGGKRELCLIVCVVL